MKRYFYFLLALSLCACTQKEKIEENSSEGSNLSFWWPKHDSINHAYLVTADPVWQFGRHGEDIYDWTYQEQWYNECRKILISTYDSIHPGAKGADKDLRMLDELIQFFETEPDYSTMGMIIANDLGENFAMYKVVSMYRSIAAVFWLKRDKLTVEREIEAWNDFHRLLNRFCVNMKYLGWYGGSGAGPACTSLNYDITNQRLKDVERLNHFYHDELPINHLICANAPNCQFEDAVDSVINKRKLTPEAHQWYTESEYAGYEKEYYTTIACRDSLIDAYHNWTSARKSLLRIKNRNPQRDKMIVEVTNLVLRSGKE